MLRRAIYSPVFVNAFTVNGQDNTTASVPSSGSTTQLTAKITVVSLVNSSYQSWSIISSTVPVWLHPTGENTGTLNLVAEANYTGESRNCVVEILQSGTNKIAQITMSQVASSLVFNISGSFYYNEYSYGTVTNKSIPVTSIDSSDGSIVPWAIVSGATPSWITGLSVSGQNIVYSVSNTTGSNQSFEVVLRQNISNSEIILNISSYRAVRGGVAGMMVNILFIAASDGVYYRDTTVVGSKFVKTNLTSYTYSQLTPVNGHMYCTTYYSVQSWNGTQWVNNSNNHDPKLLYRWDVASKIFVPILDVNGVEYNRAGSFFGGLFYRGLSTADNRYLVSSFRTDSGGGKLLILDTVSDPTKVYSDGAYSFSRATNMTTNAALGGEYFMGDVLPSTTGNPGFYVMKATGASDTYLNKVTGLPELPDYTYSSLVSLGNDNFIAGYVLQNSGYTTTGRIRKFKMTWDGTNFVASDLVEIILSDGITSYYAPNNGAQLIGGKLYVGLNGANYACAIIDVVSNDYVLVPYGSECGFSYVYIINNRVYISSNPILKGTTTTLFNIGIIEIVNNGDGTYSYVPTNVVTGNYSLGVYNGGDLLIPGEALAVTYDKVNNRFAFVEYE